MRKGILVGLAAVMAGGCAGVASYPVSRRPVAAVMEFDYRGPDQEYSSCAAGLADTLVNGLVKSGRLRLVERRKLQSAMQEAALSMSGAVDPDKAVEVGKLLAAHYIIVGSVTSVSVLDERSSAVVATRTTRTARVMAEARMLEVSTGLLVATGVARGEAEGAEKQALGAKTGTLPDKVALVHQAMIGLGDKLAAELAESIQPLEPKGRP